MDMRNRIALPSHLPRLRVIDPSFSCPAHALSGCQVPDYAPGWNQSGGSIVFPIIWTGTSDFMFILWLFAYAPRVLQNELWTIHLLVVSTLVASTQRVWHGRATVVEEEAQYEIVWVELFSYVCYVSFNRELAQLTIKSHVRYWCW